MARTESLSTITSANTLRENTFTFGKRFSVVDKLGVGAHGKVYLAFDTEHRRQVAIKVPLLVDPKKLGVRRSREVAVLLTLQHPNILRLFAVLRLDNSLDVMLVTDACDRGTLLDVVNDQGPLTEETTRVFFRQIADGLAYAHRHGFAHRDIKLENIFLKGGHRIIIGDWGYAAECTEGQKFNGEWVGSEAYCAPELLCTSPYDGRAVDVWAAGVVLYAMLHKELPFNTTSRRTRLRQIYQEGPQFVDELSHEYKLLVSSMLHPLPDFRVNMQTASNNQWVRDELHSSRTT